MNIYEKLGVRQYINAAATLTMYGGSIMPPEVVEAMREASKSYVDLLELHKKAGEYIAKLTNNEAAFISNGAASGMVYATAAAVAGDDTERREALPLSGGKNEIVLSQAGRVRYDFAIKIGGGKYVPYGDEKNGTAEQLEAAITPNTAAIFMFYFEHRMGNQPSFETQVKIAKKHGIYLFVDAAAQLPARENLWRFTKAGADLVIFSGGKGLRGPQSTGLVVGRKDLIDRILTITSPNAGIGRPMKVGKEEIVGLLTAIKLYMDQDEAVVLAGYERQVRYALDEFEHYAGVQAARSFPSEAGQPMPRAQLVLTPGAFKIDAEGLVARLKEGRPAILASGDGDTVQLNPQTLLDGEMEIVVTKIKEVLTANRA